jgi:hypothetical protein
MPIGQNFQIDDTMMKLDAPWLLAELIGTKDRAKRSTHPRLLGVVFEKLPLQLRQRWWRETDYGRRDASPALVMAIAAHVGSTARKCSRMLKKQEGRIDKRKRVTAK